MKLTYTIDRNPEATRSVIIDIKDMKIPEVDGKCYYDRYGIEKYSFEDLPFTCVEAPVGRVLKYDYIKVFYEEEFKNLPVLIPLMTYSNHSWNPHKYIIKLEQLKILTVDNYNEAIKLNKYIKKIKFKVYNYGCNKHIYNIEYEHIIGKNEPVLSYVLHNTNFVIMNALKSYISTYFIKMSASNFIIILENKQFRIGCDKDLILYNKFTLEKIIIDLKYIERDFDQVIKILDRTDLNIDMNYKGYIQFRLDYSDKVFAIITEELFKRYIKKCNVQLNYNPYYSRIRSILEDFDEIRKDIKETIILEMIRSDNIIDIIKNNERYLNIDINFEDAKKHFCKDGIEKFCNEYKLDKNSSVKIKWFIDNLDRFNDNYQKPHIITLLRNKIVEYEKNRL